MAYFIDFSIRYSTPIYKLCVEYHLEACPENSKEKHDIDAQRVLWIFVEKE